MNPSELAALTQAGAGPQAVFDATGKPVAGTPANATCGYARCINGDGTKTLTAFIIGGAAPIAVTVPQ